MMIVNLANTVRLQNRMEEATKLLDKEDWSATNDQFQVCVASVRGDIDKVLTLMEELGTRENPNNYRRWPVFRVTRDNPRFVKKFEEIFHEPLLLIANPGDTNLSSDTPTA